MKIKFVFIVALAFLSVFVQAQSNHHIQLLDEEDGRPISNVEFAYQNQKGISTADGLITFQYIPGARMQLSHLSYGKWEWNDGEVQRLMQKKQARVRSTAIDLYPVTILAVRPQDKPEELHNISYQDRMEHDATVILMQTAAISGIRKGGSYGFDPVFRGFKYDQLNIVLNGGQSATAACPNRMDPPTSQFAPNMIDRIEILKGPHALRYGAGFGATINFVPGPLRFSEEAAVYGRVSAGYESNGNLARGETQIGLSGSVYDLSLFGSWSQGDDYQSGDGTTVASDFQRGSFGANMGFKLTSNQQLRLSAVYNRARDADFPALPMDLREDDTWLLNARHDWYIGGSRLQSWNTSIFGSFVDHLMDNRLKDLNPRMMNAETFAQTYNYGGRTESNWSFGQSKLYAGIDLRMEGAKGTREREFLMGPNAGKIMFDNVWQEGQINKTGLFGELHLPFNQLHLVLASRMELNSASINDPDQLFGQVYNNTEVQQINPSISAGLVKPIGKTFNMGIWLGHVNRSGSLTERFINYFPVGLDPYELIGNPQIKAEKNNQIDLTLAWKQERSSLNIDVFASWLTDYITSEIDTTLKPRLPASPGVRRFTNIDNAFKTGFEFRWSYQLPMGLQNQLSLAYTWAQNIDKDQPLPEIAPLDIRYALFGNYLGGKLKPNLLIRYAAEQTRVSVEYGEASTPSFFLLDLGLSYAITSKLTSNFAVNNLLNENYYEHLSRFVAGSATPIYAPGRNISVKVSYTF